MSLPSPLLLRNGSSTVHDVSSSSEKKSPSVQSLAIEHLSVHQRNKSGSPAGTKKQNATAVAKSRQHSPQSFTAASSRSVTPTFKMSPLTLPTDGHPNSHGNSKRLSLKKSQKLLSPEVSSTESHCDSIPKSLSAATLSTDDSLCSSRSSPSLLSDSVTRPPLSPPGKTGVPLTPYSRSQARWSSERDLRKLEQSGAARNEKEVLDLFILAPNSDFYHHLYTAWQDEKIVSFFIT